MKRFEKGCTQAVVTVDFSQPQTILSPKYTGGRQGDIFILTSTPYPRDTEVTAIVMHQGKAPSRIPARVGDLIKSRDRNTMWIGLLFPDLNSDARALLKKKLAIADRAPRWRKGEQGLGQVVLEQNRAIIPAALDSFAAMSIKWFDKLKRLSNWDMEGLDEETIGLLKSFNVSWKGSEVRKLIDAPSRSAFPFAKIEVLILLLGGWLAIKDKLAELTGALSLPPEQLREKLEAMDELLGEIHNSTSAAEATLELNTVHCEEWVKEAWVKFNRAYDELQQRTEYFKKALAEGRTELPLKDGEGKHKNASPPRKSKERKIPLAMERPARERAGLNKMVFSREFKRLSLTLGIIVFATIMTLVILFKSEPEVLKRFAKGPMHKVKHFEKILDLTFISRKGLALSARLPANWSLISRRGQLKKIDEIYKLAQRKFRTERLSLLDHKGVLRVLVVKGLVQINR